MARKARDYQAEYARRLASAEARGKTRQQARGHRAGEHIERAEREREEFGGLTGAQVKAIHKWAAGRITRQPSNMALNPDDMVAYAAQHGFESYSKFRQDWERQRRNYKRRPAGKGENTLDDLFADVDVDELGVEWLYYH